MSSISYNKTISELHKAIVELNYKNKVDIHNLHKNANAGSSIEDSSKDKRLLTIQNPYRLNTNNNHIHNEWVITYKGRDLSLEEDNYRWDIHNGEAGIRGYWIVEREFHMDEWLYVRWGRTPTNVKERRETIHKGRLKDMDIIQRDMINAVRGTIYNTIK
jgi:hypothetical protein